jgi:hypothetical protein
MKIAKAIEAVEAGQLTDTGDKQKVNESNAGKRPLRQVKSNDNETSAGDLDQFLRKVSEASARGIEVLIGELHGLRDKLQSDGSRLQRDIEKHAELSQGVLQLTTIISNGVKKIPGTPVVNG